MKFPSNTYTLCCDPDGNWFVVGTTAVWNRSEAVVLFIADEDQRIDLVMHSYVTTSDKYVAGYDSHHLEYYKRTPFNKRKTLPKHVVPTLTSYTFKEVVEQSASELLDFYNKVTKGVVFVEGLPRYKEHEHYVPDDEGVLAPPDAKFDFRIESIKVIENE